MSSSSRKTLPPRKVLPRQSSLKPSSYQTQASDAAATSKSNLENDNTLKTSNLPSMGHAKLPSSSNRTVPPEPTRTASVTKNMASLSLNPAKQKLTTPPRNHDSTVLQHSRIDERSMSSLDRRNTSPQLSEGADSRASGRDSPSNLHSLQRSGPPLKSGPSDEENLSTSLSSQQMLAHSHFNSDLASTISDNTTGTINCSKSRTIQSILNSLESKSKQDLLVISKKMVSEINVKNRIINESRINEKWILAQLAVAQNGTEVTLDENPTALQTKFSKSSVSVEDKEFLQTLMAFKAELGAAKKKIEEQEVSLSILEKKRTAVEEEAAYLRTILNPQLKDPSVPQMMRIKELEKKLNETIQDYTNLQSKVSQWARSSKRNQEGRIAAEAVHKALEEENEHLKAQLAGKIHSGLPIIPAPSSSDEGKRIKALEEQLAIAREAQIKNERQSDYEIDSLERKQVELLDTIESLKIKNQELQDTIGSRDEYQSIIKKRSSMLVDGKQSLLSVKNVGEVDINREYNFLKDKYTQLEEENNELRESEKSLMNQLEVAHKDCKKAMEKWEDQEELQYAMKEMEIERKNLQDAYNVALDKIQQKNLAIEMLQKNVDKARERIEPLQKSVEALDDLQDLLDQERYMKEELQNRITVLEEDCQSQRKKIMTLMEQVEKKDNYEEHIDAVEIKELRENTKEYKSVIDDLNAKLAAKEEHQNNLLNSNQSRQANELQVIKATVEEQSSTIEQLEHLIAEDNQVIEQLKSEKSKLTQKLSIMQQMKQEFDKQSVEYDALVEKVKRLQANTSSIADSSGNRDLNSGDLDRISRLEESMAELSAQNDLLLSQLESYHDLEEEYKDEVALRKNLEQKLDQMDSEFDLLQSEFDEKVRHVDELEKKLSEIRAGEKGTKLEQEQTFSDLTGNEYDPSPVKEETLLFSKSQENLAGLIAKLDAAEMEIEELQMQLAKNGLDNNVNSLKNAETLSSLKDHDDVKIEDNFYKISLFEKEIQEKQNEIDKLLGEVDQLEERLLQASEEKYTLERQNKRIIEELNADHEAEVNELVAKMKEMTESNDMSLNQKRIGDLEKEIAYLNSQLNSQERFASENTLEFPLNSEINDLKMIINEKNNMIKSLEDQMQMIVQKNAVDDKSSTSKLNEVEQLLKEKEAQILDLKTMIHDDSVGMDKKYENGENIASELELYRKKYDDSLRQISNLEATVTDLKDKLEHYTEIAEDALKQLDDCENKLLELRKQTADGKSIDSGEVEELREILNRKDSEISSLKSQINELRDAKEEIENLGRTNEQLLDKIATLSQEMALRDNNRISINPNSLAQRSLEATKSELEEVKQQLNEAILKINTFQHEKAELIDELDDLRDHNMMLISQLHNK